MRVSFVVPRYLPHLGGVENHVHAIASRLQDLGHQVTVATQREGDRSLPAIERASNGLVIRRFPSALQVRGHGIAAGLRRWVRSGADGADIVHLHNFHAVTTLLMAGVARTPFLLTPHYLGPGEGRAESALHTAYAAAMRRALRRVSRVICVTDSEAVAFGRRVGFADRCRVIPNGVDSAAIRAAKPVAGVGRLLVLAGRLEEYKQPQPVLEALAHLPLDFRLAIIGSGPVEPTLRRRVHELGLTDRVLFPGRLPAGEMYSWFRGADVVVSMSRRECFGLTLAEGLASGAAVVASDIGAHRDVIALSASAAAVLVPMRASPGDIAAAVFALASLPREHSIPSLPTWDDVVLAILRTYDDVLAEGHRADSD